MDKGKKTFIAVKKGRQTGIFTSWEECKQYVIHYPDAEYKSFDRLIDAEFYMGLKRSTEHDLKPEDKVCIAYVDGSFNKREQICGYGVYIMDMSGNEIVSLYGGIDDEISLASWNVSGEIESVYKAVEYAIENGYKQLEIYYDYEGIEKWANDKWKTNKILTQNYKDFIRKSRKYINLHFHKVKGHSGDKYNDIADELAKKGAKII